MTYVLTRGGPVPIRTSQTHPCSHQAGAGLAGAAVDGAVGAPLSGQNGRGLPRGTCSTFST